MTSAIELNPDVPSLYLTRGRLYAALEDNARASADLEQVLALTQDEALVVPARQLLILLQ
jgi:tetratricopeptide (TPR) repeat protein